MKLSEIKAKAKDPRGNLYYGPVQKDINWLIGHIDALAAALLEVEEYFDQRADAEYLPGQAAPIGNEEMRLLCLIRGTK